MSEILTQPISGSSSGSNGKGQMKKQQQQQQSLGPIRVRAHQGSSKNFSEDHAQESERERGYAFNSSHE
jgi:hypothetical protein